MKFISTILAAAVLAAASPAFAQVATLEAQVEEFSRGKEPVRPKKPRVPNVPRSQR